MPRTNKIIEAANLDDEYDNEDAGEGSPYDTDEVTVDQMNDLMDSLDPRTKSGVDNTRQRGGKSARPTAAAVHASRAKQLRREDTSRVRPGDWRPSDTLYAPPPTPGKEQRWIRVRLGEKDDPRNFQKKFREGWEPVKLSEVNEEYNPPSDTFGRFGNVIMVSDLVLCERDISIGLARKKHFAGKLKRHLDSAHRRAVDRVERDDHKITRAFKTESTAGIGRRNRTPVQDDAE